MTKATFLLVIFGLGLGVNCVLGFSSGAPSLTPVCRSMTPIHGANPQLGESPYKVSLDKNSVEGGEFVRITLEGKDSNKTSPIPFKGFLAMGRKVASVNGTSILNLNSTSVKGEVELDPERIGFGRFIQEVRPNVSSAFLADFTDCFGRSSSSITHLSSVPKDKIVFDWQAPNLNDNFVISVTFVQSRSSFWVGQQSEVIKVKRVSKDVKDVPEDSEVLPNSNRAVALFHEFFKHAQHFVQRVEERLSAMF